MYSNSIKTKTYSTSEIELIAVGWLSISYSTRKRKILRLTLAQLDRKYRQEEKSIEYNRPITDQNQYWLQRKSHQLLWHAYRQTTLSTIVHHPQNTLGQGSTLRAVHFFACLQLHNWDDREDDPWTRISASCLH